MLFWFSSIQNSSRSSRKRPPGCDIRESRNIVWQCHRDWGTFSSFSAAFSRLMSDWSRGRRGPEEMGQQHTFLEFLELFVGFVWDFFDNFLASSQIIIQWIEEYWCFQKTIYVCFSEIGSRETMVDCHGVQILTLAWSLLSFFFMIFKGFIAGFTTMARWVNRGSFCLWVCLGKFACWRNERKKNLIPQQPGLSNKRQKETQGHFLRRIFVRK